MPKKSIKESTGKSTSKAIEVCATEREESAPVPVPEVLSEYIELIRNKGDLVQSQEDFIRTLENIDDEIFSRTIFSMFHMLPSDRLMNPAGQMPIWYKVHFLDEDDDHHRIAQRLQCVMLYLILELNAHDIHPIPMEPGDRIAAGNPDLSGRIHNFSLEKEDMFILFGYRDVDEPQPAVGLLLVSPGSGNHTHCEESAMRDEEILNRVLAQMPKRVIN